MEPTDDLFDEVEAFLNNQLPPAEETVFRQRLEQDEALRNEVAMHRLMAQGLDAAATKRRLKIAQRARQRQPIGRRTARLATVVALVGALLMGGYYAYEWLRPPTMQELTETYGPPESPIRADTTLPTGLGAALTSYYAGQYASTLTKLERIPPDSLRLVAYYRGLTLLALNRYDQARHQLAQARQSPNSVVGQRADWYTAMTYLRAGDAAQTRRELTPIVADSTHRYHRFAVELIDKLP